MVDHKMCIGIVKEIFMARIDPEGYDMDSDLECRIDPAPEFNPRSKAIKQKKG
jgi:hypothetical protein